MCINVPEPENFAIRLHELYSGEFRCESIKKKKWLCLSKERWIEVEDGFLLYKRISNELLHEFEVALLDLESKKLDLHRSTLTQESTETREAMNQESKKINNCKKILRLLKNTTFKNKIMKEASVLFLNHDL